MLKRVLRLGYNWALKLGGDSRDDEATSRRSVMGLELLIRAGKTTKLSRLRRSYTLLWSDLSIGNLPGPNEDRLRIV
jgi:hypothetical protein